LIGAVRGLGLNIRCNGTLAIDVLEFRSVFGFGINSSLADVCVETSRLHAADHAAWASAPAMTSPGQSV
jgi:hypothetical protein